MLILLPSQHQLRGETRSGHVLRFDIHFLPAQVFNFVYSIPQLFKWVHCPRHRLPKFDPATGLLTATPNYNLVNLTLYVGGPCTEQQLCVRLLTMQALSCAAGFGVRHLLVGVWK